jgi:lipopolysaccharide transport system ATP-binding protein
MNAHAGTPVIEAAVPAADVVAAAATEPTSASDEALALAPALNQDFETGLAEIDSVVLLCEGAPTAAVISDSEVTLRVVVVAHADVEDPHVGFQIRNARGEPVFMTTTYGMGQSIGALRKGQSVAVNYTMKLALAAGEYTITSGIANGGYGDSFFREQLVRRHAVARFSVAADRLGIRWGGVCNLHPVLRISREDETASLAGSST